MKTLKLKDGGTLNYRDTGQGQPILLLHGWAMRGDLFEHQVANLSLRHRTIVPDLRGHGGSSALPEGRGMDALIDDICCLLTDLDLSQVVVVGWSMGAMIGWGLMTRSESERVAALVSIDMVPRLLNDTEWNFGLRSGSDVGVFAGAVARMIDDWPRYTRTFIPRIFARDRDSTALAERMIRDTAQNDSRTMARLWLSLAGQDFKDALHSLRVPSLVAYGALSQLYNEAASLWMVDEIPQATAARFENSGHAPHLEEPELFNQVIETFIGSLKTVPGIHIAEQP